MTLFIGIGQHLDHSIFYNQAASAKPKKKNNNKKKSKKKAEEEEEGEDGAPIARLDKGQAVTAVPSPGAFNDSSYATVVAAFDGEMGTGFVQIQKHGHEATEWVARHLVHPRRLISTAFVFVSDDKKHDTWAVQKFIPRIDKYYDQHVPQKIDQVHIRSDGASSHFKSRFTLHWLTEHFGKHKRQTREASAGEWEETGGGMFTRMTWDVGCPGHGKVCSCLVNGLPPPLPSPLPSLPPPPPPPPYIYVCRARGTESPARSRAGYDGTSPATS